MNHQIENSTRELFCHRTIFSILTFSASSLCLMKICLHYHRLTAQAQQLLATLQVPPLPVIHNIHTIKYQLLPVTINVVNAIFDRLHDIMTRLTLLTIILSLFLVVSGCCLLNHQLTLTHWINVCEVVDDNEACSRQTGPGETSGSGS